MYKVIIRPLLFNLPPETVHRLIVKFIKAVFKIPLIPQLIETICNTSHKKLRTHFLELTFKNPVGLAAGFDKNAEIYNEFRRFGFSFIEIGTVTPRAQSGNPKPRSFRIPTDKALINRMGFNNEGVDTAVKRLRKRSSNVIIGGNIGKNTDTPNDEAIQDYIYAFKQIYDHVDYIVINLSCPNIKNLNELQDKGKTIQIINELDTIRSGYNKRKPILLKISPDLTVEQLDDAIDIYYKTGIDGIIATNTTITRDGLSIPEEEVESIGNGGLSGEPLKNTSTKIIRYISEKTDGEVPIIGVGGIMSTEDAIEKLKAGAKLVQVYTGFIYNGPVFIKKINKAIVKSL